MISLKVSEIQYLSGIELRIDLFSVSHDVFQYFKALQCSKDNFASLWHILNPTNCLKTSIYVPFQAVGE